MSAEAGAAPAAGRAPGGRPTFALLVAACLTLAAASLLLPGAPTYDPWAWIIWGREITEGALDTREGPSWKPLPVLFTTPFALAGDAAAPDLWLVVARAGGLLAVAMAFRLGQRLAGRAAGAVAAVGLLLAEDFVRHAARGNSEGLLVGLVLWGVERHLEGRRAHAFLLGLGAALLRPEIWPFWGAYGIWLLAREPRRRRLVLSAFALVPLLWFGPEWAGSGNPLRAASRALEPTLSSPAYAEHPWLEVLRRSAEVLAVPLLAGALLGGVLALRAVRHGASPAERERAGVAVALAASATVLLIGVAVMTQAGFAGNLRYVALPAALVCLVAGFGWAALVRRAARGRRRVGALLAAAAIAASVPFAIASMRALGDDLDGVAHEAAIAEDLATALARAGGPPAVNGCEAVYTTPYQVQLVAWELHRHGQDVAIHPFPPGYAVALRGSRLARDPRFPRVAASAHWAIGRSCGRP